MSKNKLIASAIASAAVVGTFFTFPAAAQAQECNFIPTHVNGYTVKNNTTETLVLDRATQWFDTDRTVKRTTCGWKKEPPAEIAPATEANFSIGIVTPSGWSGGDFWDQTDLVYSVKGDPTKKVKLDANVGVNVKYIFFGYKRTVIGDSSHCSFDGNPAMSCQFGKSEGRGTETSFKIHSMGDPGDGLPPES